MQGEEKRDEKFVVISSSFFLIHSPSQVSRVDQTASCSHQSPGRSSHAVRSASVRVTPIGTPSTSSGVDSPPSSTRPSPSSTTHRVQGVVYMTVALMGHAVVGFAFPGATGTTASCPTVRSAPPTLT